MGWKSEKFIKKIKKCSLNVDTVVLGTGTHMQQGHHHEALDDDAAFALLNKPVYAQHEDGRGKGTKTKNHKSEKDYNKSWKFHEKSSNPMQFSCSTSNSESI